MGKRIYFEDATSLALLFNYEATGNKLLSKSIVEEFDEKIDEKLDKINYEKFCVHPLDRSTLIYFPSEDENGKKYFILKDNINYNTFGRYYLAYPKEVYKAITSDEVLNVLGLCLEDGKMRRKEIREDLTFKIKSTEIALLVTLLINSDEEMLKEVKGDLLEVYYDDLKARAKDGFISDEITVINKPNLYNYIMRVKEKMKISGPVLQKKINNKKS